MTVQNCFSYCDICFSHSEILFNNCENCFSSTVISFLAIVTFGLIPVKTVLIPVKSVLATLKKCFNKITSPNSYYLQNFAQYPCQNLFEHPVEEGEEGLRLFTLQQKRDLRRKSDGCEELQFVHVFGRSPIGRATFNHSMGFLFKRGSLGGKMLNQSI